MRKKIIFGNRGREIILGEIGKGEMQGVQRDQEAVGGTRGGRGREAYREKVRPRRRNGEKEGTERRKKGPREWSKEGQRWSEIPFPNKAQNLKP